MTKIIAFMALFVGTILILYLGLSMFSAVPQPSDDSEEFSQFESLTKIVNISYKGFFAVALILLASILIAVIRMIGK